MWPLGDGFYQQAETAQNLRRISARLWGEPKARP